MAVFTAHRLVDGEALLDLRRGEALLQQGVARDLVRFAALAAQPPHQALGHDQQHRGGDVEGRHAHVGQAGQGLGGVVGVQGGQHQVARLRRLDRDLRRLQVADLTHHNDVRVLTQEGAQGGGEGQARLGVHVDLIDPGNLDLHRVLDGGDIHVRLVEDVQAGVEGDGLARARGARDQDHAIGLVDGLQKGDLLLLVEAQLLDAHQGGPGLQDTQHHLLAVEGGEGIDAKVDVPGAAEFELDAPILGHPALGDVHARHDLEPRHQAVGDVDRRRGHLVQHAILAEADAEALLVRLEVDVGGAAGDGVDEDLVDVAHHRRLIHVELLFRALVLLGSYLFEIDQVGGHDLAHDRMLGLMEAVDGLLHGQRQLVLLHQHRLGGQAGVEADLV